MLTKVDGEVPKVRIYAGQKAYMLATTLTSYWSPSPWQYITALTNESPSPFPPTFPTQYCNTRSSLLVAFFPRLYGLLSHTDLFLKRRCHHSRGFPATRNISLCASSRDIISGQGTSSVKMETHLSAENNVAFLGVSTGARLVDWLLHCRLSMAASRLTTGRV